MAASAETVLDTRLSLGGRLVDVVQVTGDDPGVIWRCGCGRQSGWPFTSDVLDPVAQITAIAHTHASTCTN